MNTLHLGDLSKFADTKKILADALVQEYNQGFDDALRVVISGLETSYEKAKRMPEAQGHLAGLETSIYVTKGMKEDLDSRRNAQN